MGGSSHISNHACCRGHFIRSLPTLFTEWKCNLDCHYYWAFDNSVKGMTEDVAKRSIDWLHSTTCRAGLYGRGSPVAAAIGAQGFLLCRQERLLDLHADKCPAAAARCD